MEKQVISEHQLQYAIHNLLQRCKVIHWETDVMDALKYFGKNQKARFGYINHHKKMGYLKGQPDLVVLRRGQVYFVELKTKNGRQSQEQRDLGEMLNYLGYNYIIWRSLEDCADFLKK